MLAFPRLWRITLPGLLCLLVLGGQALAAQSTHRRLAVLEFAGRNLESDVLEAFSDAVRGGALEGLAGRDIKVMTRESMMVLLREMGKSECVEGDCEVETARNIGADFVISGIVVRMEDSYVVTLKLHETKEGGLLATQTVNAVRQIEVLTQLRARARDLVAGLASDGRREASPSSKESTPAIGARPQPSAPAKEVGVAPLGAVHAHLRSADPERRWDVYVDDEAVCTTPCSRWVDPSRAIAMRTRDGRLGTGPDKVRLDDLSRVAGQSNVVMIRAYPTSLVEQVGGILVTTFGGMATVTGVALVSVGYATSGHEGMRSAGLASGIPGLLAVAGGIWLILDSRPRVTVDPTILPPAARASGVSISAGPGFVAGRF